MWPVVCTAKTRSKSKVVCGVYSKNKSKSKVVCGVYSKNNAVRTRVSLKWFVV